MRDRDEESGGRDLEAAQRAAAVAEARRWLGTPYHHHGDVRQVGVDCAMLLVRVYVDIGLIPAFDPRQPFAYPVDWHLHRDEERYLGFILERAGPVEVPQPGDVMVWRYGRTFSHGGIVTAWEDGAHTVIHAYYKAGMVEEADVSLAGPLSDPKRERRCFSPWRRL